VDAAGYRAGCVTVIQERQAGHLVLDNGMPVPQSARPRGARPETSAAETILAPQPARPAANPGGRPLVAAIFPGQGSQYTDMFRGLVEESAEARSWIARLDRLARDHGRETLAEIAWRPDNGLGTRIWDTQWAMYLGDLLAWGVLQEMGFSPDVVASHSFGEFPSLAAVGAWSVEDGARATKARADAVERHGPRNGAMLSVIADRAEVAAAILPFAEQVWVCAENAPEQSVVGGQASAQSVLFSYDPPNVTSFDGGSPNGVNCFPALTTIRARGYGVDFSQGGWQAGAQLQYYSKRLARAAQ
jgi:hypothetical protein